MKTEIIGNDFVISIPLEEIKSSLESGQLDMSIGGEFKITDMDDFLVEFREWLMMEEEDGATPVHLMLDQVAEAMLEYSDAGCSIKKY